MMVARRGKVVHFSALGERDAESGAPMTHDAIFRIASMTKPIVSTALMMLYEEGHFQLRDPISKWLPEFADMQVAIPPPTQERVTVRYKTIPAARPITVQHILTHTEGLANSYRGIMQPEFQEMSAQTKPGDTVGDMLKRLATLPLNFHPGDAWEYGRGTDVVGRLVEVMSGQTLDEFLRERIFEPLDMTDTHFYVPESKLGRFTALYHPDADGKIELTEAPTAASRFFAEPRVYFSGAGGLASTARDYFRFHQMMLNGGELEGTRILSPEDGRADDRQPHRQQGDLARGAGLRVRFGLCRGHRPWAVRHIAVGGFLLLDRRVRDDLLGRSQRRAHRHPAAAAPTLHASQCPAGPRDDDLSGNHGLAGASPRTPCRAGGPRIVARLRANERMAKRPTPDVRSLRSWQRPLRRCQRGGDDLFVVSCVDVPVGIGGVRPVHIGELAAVAGAGGRRDQ